MKDNNKTVNPSLPENGSVEPLEWNEHIRRHPEMYIGPFGDDSDPKDGIYTMLKGVLSMAIDDWQMGYGKSIDIDVNERLSAIRYHGRAIPLGSVVSATSGITVGIGTRTEYIRVHPVKVANALSSEFYVESYNDGDCAWARYSMGVLLEKGFHKTNEDNGTYIKFVPDSDVFAAYPFQMEIVEGILYEIARDNNGLSISINDASI